jgi:WD40 repeat protein
VKLQDGRGIEAPRWNSGEIMTSDDLSFLTQQGYQNATNLLALRTPGGTPSVDYVLSGLRLTWSSGMTCYLSAGAGLSFKGAYLAGSVWAFVSTSGNVFSAILGQDTAVVPANGSGSDRYDTVQIRPVKTDYDQKSRSYKDPITDLITSALTYTKTDFGVEIGILQGTPGAGVAPATTSGWIKVAEIFVPTSASSISQSNIRDIEDADSWTTSPGSTVIFQEKWDVAGSNLTMSPGKRYITSASIDLSLPTSPQRGDFVEVLVDSPRARILQSDSDHVLSWRKSLFSTKGSSGHLVLRAGDFARLAYRGSGFAYQAPSKISDPATLPTSICTGVSWSPNGRYLALSCFSTPYVVIYDWITGVPIKISDPSNLPTGAAIGIGWSPDGRYLAVAHSTSPYITIYDWNTGSPVKISDPGTLPTGQGNAIGWSPDGRYLAIGHSNSPYVTIYDWNTGSPVKISDPGTLPTGQGRGVDFSPDGRYLAVAHITTPFITIYDWLTGAPSKITNPTTLPGNDGVGASWSPDGRYLAVASTPSPPVNVYDWISGVPIKMPDPATLPSGGATIGARFSRDGRYLVVCSDTSSSPKLAIYERTPRSIIKISDPGTLPTGSLDESDFSPDNRYLAVAHNTSPYVTIYDLRASASKEWILVDFRTKRIIHGDVSEVAYRLK